MMPKNKREKNDDWENEREALGSEDDWESLEEGEEEEESEELLNNDAESAVDLSEDADGEDEDVFYTIRGEGYSVDGETFSRGDTVPVHCKHCSFWEKEIAVLGNKTLCFNGRKAGSDGTIYAADKFSCGTFFIPRNFQFAGLNIDELEAFRRFFTLAVRTEASKEKVRDRYRNWADKNNAAGEAEETLARAERSMFRMSEQALAYSKQFFVKYIPMQLKKRTKSATAKTSFRAGDWVNWKPIDSEERLYGMIIGLGRGKLKLAGTGETNKGVGYEYQFKYWKANCSPSIDIKTVSEGEASSE
jgi:hypothetical protein